MSSNITLISLLSHASKVGSACRYHTYLMAHLVQQNDLGVPFYLDLWAYRKIMKLWTLLKQDHGHSSHLNIGTSYRDPPHRHGYITCSGNRLMPFCCHASYWVWPDIRRACQKNMVEQFPCTMRPDSVT